MVFIYVVDVVIKLNILIMIKIDSKLKPTIGSIMYDYITVGYNKIFEDLSPVSKKALNY